MEYFNKMVEIVQNPETGLESEIFRKCRIKSEFLEYLNLFILEISGAIINPEPLGEDEDRPKPLKTIELNINDEQKQIIRDYIMSIDDLRFCVNKDCNNITYLMVFLEKCEDVIFCPLMFEDLLINTLNHLKTQNKCISVDNNDVIINDEWKKIILKYNKLARIIDEMLNKTPEMKLFCVYHKSLLDHHHQLSISAFQSDKEFRSNDLSSETVSSQYVDAEWETSTKETDKYAINFMSSFNKVPDNEFDLDTINSCKKPNNNVITNPFNPLLVVAENIEIIVNGTKYVIETKENFTMKLLNFKIDISRV